MNIIDYKRYSIGASIVQNYVSPYPRQAIRGGVPGKTRRSLNRGDSGKHPA
jgi:hypothetical protein